MEVKNCVIQGGWPQGPTVRLRIKGGLVGAVDANICEKYDDRSWKASSWDLWSGV